MSTHLEEVKLLRDCVTKLQQALDALSLRVVELESKLSSPSDEGWELVEDSTQGPSLGYYPPSRYCEVESGPLTFRPSSCPLHLDCRQSSLVLSLGPSVHLPVVSTLGVPWKPVPLTQEHLPICPLLTQFGSF